MRQLLDEILPRDEIIDEFAVEGEFPRLGRCQMLLNARHITGNPPLILLAMEQVPRLHDAAAASAR